MENRFLRLFYPMFQNSCLLIQRRNITPFINNFSVSWLGQSIPYACRCHWNLKPGMVKQAYLYHVESTCSVRPADNTTAPGWVITASIPCPPVTLNLDVYRKIRVPFYHRYSAWSVQIFTFSNFSVFNGLIENQYRLFILIKEILL